MTPPDVLEKLIARLEAATGPSRELDGEIEIAVRPTTGVPLGYTQEWAEATRRRGAPAYTSSIDAALTLVPDGWTRFVDATAPDMGIAVGLCAPCNGGVELVGSHASEPLATCLAAVKALRARAAGDM